MEVLSIFDSEKTNQETHYSYNTNPESAAEASLSKKDLLKNDNKNKRFSGSLSDIRELKMFQFSMNNPFYTYKTTLAEETTKASVAIETTEIKNVTESTDISVTETTQLIETTSTTEATTETITQTTNQSEDTSTTQQEQTTTTQVVVSSDYISRMFDLINAARAEQGISPLSLNGTLNALACSRCNDMLSRNYFSHTTPEGKNVYTILQENGIGYSSAGENIANSSPASSASAELHFNIWINSSTHRDNILNGGFSQIGIGFGSEGSLFISTLIFIG